MPNRVARVLAAPSSGAMSTSRASVANHADLGSVYPPSTPTFSAGSANSGGNGLILTMGLAPLVGAGPHGRSDDTGAGSPGGSGPSTARASAANRSGTADAHAVAVSSAAGRSGNGRLAPATGWSPGDLPEGAAGGVLARGLADARRAHRLHGPGPSDIVDEIVAAIIDSAPPTHLPGGEAAPAPAPGHDGDWDTARASVPNRNGRWGAYLVASSMESSSAANSALLTEPADTGTARHGLSDPLRRAAVPAVETIPVRAGRAHGDLADVTSFPPSRLVAFRMHLASAYAMAVGTLLLVLGALRRPYTRKA